MSKIAALMPVSTFEQQFAQSHLQQIGRLAGAENFHHFESLVALQSNPNATDTTILITGWGAPRLTPGILQHCPALELVVHGAGSLRSVFDPALFTHGVRSTSSASANAVPVAEFLVSWVLRWNKKLPYWESAYRQPSVYNDKSDKKFASIGNRDKVVGIISASKVGCCFASLLRSFDLTVTMYDPFLDEQQIEKLGAEKLDLPTLLRQSDIVSINTPLLPETQHLIAESELAQMRDGTLLINTARGGVLDHDALLAELQSGRLSAVLDVTDPEPLPADSPFFALSNAFITPHVAGSMGVEIYRMTESAIEEIARFLTKGKLNHEVSISNWSTAA